MIEDRRGEGGGAPHAVIFAVVVVAVVVISVVLGDDLGQVLTDFIAELLSPVGLLLLPIGLLLVIVFLSSDAGSAFSGLFSTGEPDSIHRVSGSPVGVALFLALILFLLYSRVAIFGGDDGSDE
ncbi:hypothetical protein RHMOL_Rhmol04G0358900 [Rhododendron molle]|uniref:Uncharacterized protein n=1 Tax=Rhododendron molle TaxID=49168 RepID=A0ACC0PAC1_RHOML|nr:hypothetical protein RHMOL_Rhmol04G0358900 [Rhododendron molle]